ncbi:MAG: manganese transporter permease [Bdellovibrionia bacterium]
MSKWLVFLKERFNPLQYIPTIAVFLAANALYISRSENLEITTLSVFLTFLMLTSFFLRMRLFDEIKDYEVDLKINPTRPLARGLITINEVKKAIVILLAAEALIAMALSPGTLVIWLVAALYSLLMYKEFFIGRWLRPHLTTYAITHTFVVNLLALLIMAGAAGFQWQDLHAYHEAFIAMNWCYFNLFEFARKTFAATEERSGVDTYSSLFKPLGAWFLSIKEVLLGVILINASTINPLFFIGDRVRTKVAILAMIYFVLSLSYLFTPSLKTAKFFRTISGIYLLTHFLILAWTLY